MPTEKGIDEFIRGKCVEANIAISKAGGFNDIDKRLLWDNIRENTRVAELADILLAIRWCILSGHRGADIVINSFGEIWKWDLIARQYLEQVKVKNNNGYDSSVIWNLELPYHAQTLETKQFIYQLLKP